MPLTMTKNDEMFKLSGYKRTLCVWNGILNLKYQV